MQIVQKLWHCGVLNDLHLLSNWSPWITKIKTLFVAWWCPIKLVLNCLVALVHKLGADVKQIPVICIWNLIRVSMSAENQPSSSLVLLLLLFSDSETGSGRAVTSDPSACGEWSLSCRVTMLWHRTLHRFVPTKWSNGSYFSAVDELFKDYFLSVAEFPVLTTFIGLPVCPIRQLVIYFLRYYIKREVFPPSDSAL